MGQLWLVGQILRSYTNKLTACDGMPPAATRTVSAPAAHQTPAGILTIAPGHEWRVSATRVFLEGGCHVGP